MLPTSPLTPIRFGGYYIPYNKLPFCADHYTELKGVVTGNDLTKYPDLIKNPDGETGIYTLNKGNDFGFFSSYKNISGTPIKTQAQFDQAVQFIKELTQKCLRPSPSAESQENLIVTAYALKDAAEKYAEKMGLSFKRETWLMPS